MDKVSQITPIFEEILQNLHTKELICATVVSKLWKRTIEKSLALWKRRIDVQWGDGTFQKISTILNESAVSNPNWVNIYSVPLWKERYFKGDCESVWNEIKNQQNFVFENPYFYQEVCIVTEEMMRRVRFGMSFLMYQVLKNMQRIVKVLEKFNYPVKNIIRPPSCDVEQKMNQLEADFKTKIPLALRFFWKIVGAIHLWKPMTREEMKDHLDAPHARWWNQFGFSHSNPLNIRSFEDYEADIRDAANACSVAAPPSKRRKLQPSDFDDRYDETRIYFLLDSEDISKRHVSGSVYSASWFYPLADPGIGYLSLKDSTQQNWNGTFVDYLRDSLCWGGFDEAGVIVQRKGIPEAAKDVIEALQDDGVHEEDLSGLCFKNVDCKIHGANYFCFKNSTVRECTAGKCQTVPSLSECLSSNKYPNSVVCGCDDKLYSTACEAIIQGHSYRDELHKCKGHWASIYSERAVPCRSGVDTVQNTSDAYGWEKSWIQKRMKHSLEYLKKFLPDVHLTLDNMPRIGFSHSGGGYRAAVGSAGHILGLGDDFGITVNGTVIANDPSAKYLLNSTMFMAGLSGSSWFVTSLNVLNQDVRPFVQSLQQIVSADIFAKMFEFKNYTVDGWGLIPPIQVDNRKLHPGVEYSLPTNDLISYYSSPLSTKFFNLESDLSDYQTAANVSLSDLLKDANFLEAAYPLPIFSTVYRSNIYNKSFTPWEAPQFEYTPFYVGCNTPGNQRYIPTSVLNTVFQGGLPFKNQCWKGDNLGQLIAMSGSDFEVSYEELLQEAELNCQELSVGRGLCEKLVELAIDELRKICGGNLPCPGRINNFLAGTGVKNPELNTVDTLSMVDGGFGGVNPLPPLLHRNATHIFTFDYMSVDSTYGNYLYYTQYYTDFHGIPFPKLPVGVVVPGEGVYLPAIAANKSILFLNGCQSQKNAPTLFYVQLLPNQANANPAIPLTADGLNATVYQGLIDNTAVSIASNPQVMKHIKCLLQRYAEGSATTLQCPCPEYGMCYEEGNPVDHCRSLKEEL